MHSDSLGCIGICLPIPHKCLPVALSHTRQRALGIDLGGFGVLVPQELLELLEGHPPVEEDLRYRVPQQVEVDPPLDARLFRGDLDELLDGPRGVALVAVELEEVAPVRSARWTRSSWARAGIENPGGEPSLPRAPAQPPLLLGLNLFACYFMTPPQPSSGVPGCESGCAPAG